ncbi:MAG: cysteine desulfurase [Chloroflexi bacterium]|nr:cysteine desulfurase [Chloroflexota bacterium]MYK60746.1 cysteine desulfurase [Chloroflexota bacterium]
MATTLQEVDTASQIIYLDHAATTPVREEVLDAMLPYFSEAFGNPSSLYAIAGESRNAIDEARSRVASVLNCRTSEVVFTGGGTEADNMAVKGVASTFDEPGDIVISEIEHHAIIHTAEQLEKDGHHVITVPVDRYGVVKPTDVSSRLGDSDAVVSIMFANNEVGAVNDIPEIARLAKEHGRKTGKNVVVHTDAVQASGKLSLDVKTLGVDLLSLSAHKIHGPKGVGVLYVRRGIKLEALIAGGGQERQRRSGTENVPGIVGMGMALALAENERQQFCQRTRELRDHFLAAVTERVSGVVVNNHPQNSLPHIAHISIPGLEGEPMLLGLDFKGVCASSGSACSSASVEPSHVLIGMGMSYELAAGSLRFSFGKDSREEDVQYAVNALSEVVGQLRGMPSMTA